MEKQTLGEKTAEKLLQMIREHGYTAGDKLPTEMELCELLGAGRNTVREALRILVSRNIVTIRQGAGTFISEKNGVPDDPLGFSMMEDRRKLTQDLLQIRVLLSDCGPMPAPHLRVAIEMLVGEHADAGVDLRVPRIPVSFGEPGDAAGIVAVRDGLRPLV